MDFTPRFSTLTKCLVERGLFSKQPLTLIDVGCGGGLANTWRAFGSSLRALGIDPRTAECRRLQAAEVNSSIQYIPAFIRLPDNHPFRQQRGNRSPWTGNPWERTSPAQAMAILHQRMEQAKHASELNAWHEDDLVEVATTQTLDQLAASTGFTDTDVLKIDVDGNDLEVLHSASVTLSGGPVLACILEVNFFGSTDPTDHSFHNTDRLMRMHGFDLLDLSVRRGSAAALPAPFRSDGAPHETIHGRIIQGDALYMRDPCGWANNPEAQVELSPVKLLKLACLFELFGLPDQSAELLNTHASAVAPLAEVRPLLHLLANELDPRLESYDTYIRGFQDDPESFYPSRRPS